MTGVDAERYCFPWIWMLSIVIIFTTVRRYATVLLTGIFLLLTLASTPVTLNKSGDRGAIQQNQTEGHTDPHSIFTAIPNTICTSLSGLI